VQDAFVKGQTGGRPETDGAIRATHFDKKTRRYVRKTRKKSQRATGFGEALLPSLLANGEALAVAAADLSQENEKPPGAPHLRDMVATYETLAATLKKRARWTRTRTRRPRRVPSRPRRRITPR